MKIFNGFQELTLSKKSSFLDKIGVFDPPLLSLELFQKLWEIVQERLWHIVISKKLYFHKQSLQTFAQNQARNQKYFRAAEVLWDYCTSINTSSET